ncbi:MBL fold metallo-hydrolase [Roseovarius sp.]|uniref:MBL fold metallo-hydrolase n=1 Tax=Roseovarius sp. TaxID=1486281 RepID=UPI003BAB617B
MLRLALFLIAVSSAAVAQERQPSHCIAVAEATPGVEYIQPVAYTDPVPEQSVRLRYVTHASFLLQTEGGLSAVTDFTGFLGNVDFIPDVVTMNHAHSTHWTAHPDPAIPHVLQGWGEEFGAGIDHYLDLGEMVVRNVSTDIRSAWGEGVEPEGNSIFVFEVAGLCIGHLGHLHHEPTDEQYVAIGRMDVVMVAVDGGLTLDLPSVFRVMNRLKASIVIPMHWFGDGTLGAFLDGMAERFDVVLTEGSELTVSLERLPAKPTVMVLRPAFLREGE